jgi:hypothetical protein
MMWMEAATAMAIKEGSDDSVRWDGHQQGGAMGDGGEMGIAMRVAVGPRWDGHQRP